MSSAALEPPRHRCPDCAAYDCVCDLLPWWHRECVECGRIFDMRNDIDSQEWDYGHDCEV